MELETRQNAENFLWSLVQGHDGRYNDFNQQLFSIRWELRRHVDHDLYDTKCNADCKDGSRCRQMVADDKLRCRHHR